jgi:hypothetical protein
MVLIEPGHEMKNYLEGKIKMRKTIYLFLLLMAFVMFNCSESTGPSSGTNVSSGVIDISHSGTGGVTFGLHGVDQLKRFQTFIADTSHFNITGVDVKIRRNTSSAPFNNITVELYETTGNLPTNLLAISSIDIDSLGGSFTVLHSPLKYSGLTVGNTYAIVLGQSNVMAQTNTGFEWCTANVDTNLNFGKYNGTGWVSEPYLGDGWLKVYVDKTVRNNEYTFPAGTQVVFFDDFQRTTGLVGNGWIDPSYNNQNDTTKFDINNEGGGNKAVRIKASNCFANGDTNWTDYTFSSKIKVTDPNTYVSLRFHNKDNNNLYELVLNNGVNLDLYKYASGWSDLSSSTVSYTINTYYNLKVVVHGNNFKVYFDNSVSALIDYTDPAPIANGRINLFAILNASQPAIYDDVLVTIP